MFGKIVNIHIFLNGTFVSWKNAMDECRIFPICGNMLRLDPE